MYWGCENIKNFNLISINTNNNSKIFNLIIEINNIKVLYLSYYEEY